MFGWRSSWSSVSFRRMSFGLIEEKLPFCRAMGVRTTLMLDRYSPANFDFEFLAVSR